MYVKHLVQDQAQSKKLVNVTCYYFMKININIPKNLYARYLLQYYSDNKNLKQLKCLAMKKGLLVT